MGVLLRRAVVETSVLLAVARGNGCRPRSGDGAGGESSSDLTHFQTAGGGPRVSSPSPERGMSMDVRAMNQRLTAVVCGAVLVAGAVGVLPRTASASSGGGIVVYVPTSGNTGATMRDGDGGTTLTTTIP